MIMTNENDKNTPKQDLSSEDQALFQAMMKDVKPLKSNEKNFESNKTLQKSEENTNQNKALQNQESSSTHQKLDIQVNTTPSLIKKKEQRSQKPINSEGLDRKSDERLRKGLYPIDASLDMHGMHYDEARKLLTEFILRCYETHKRCVLVITGKGGNKPQISDVIYEKQKTIGVLKENTPLWLKEDPLDPIVLKFYPAKQKHGGEGALYVLLRRKK